MQKKRRVRNEYKQILLSKIKKHAKLKHPSEETVNAMFNTYNIKDHADLANVLTQHILLIPKPVDTWQFTKSVARIMISHFTKSKNIMTDPNANVGFIWQTTGKGYGKKVQVDVETNIPYLHHDVFNGDAANNISDLLASTNQKLDELVAYFTYIDTAIQQGQNVVIGCNQCENRAPMIFLLYMLYWGIPFELSKQYATAHVRTSRNIVIQILVKYRIFDVLNEAQEVEILTNLSDWLKASPLKLTKVPKRASIDINIYKETLESKFSLLQTLTTNSCITCDRITHLMCHCHLEPYCDMECAMERH